jgi:putative endonuclease
MDTTTHRRLLDPELVRAERAAVTVVDPGGASGSVRGKVGPVTGRLGERLAAHHLAVDDHLEVVARNWRLATGELRGELDVVAVDHARATIVVCEVKTRTDAARFGGAVGALTPRQQARIRVMTGAFLREAGLPYSRVRLDLLAIDLGRQPSLSHLEGVL